MTVVANILDPVQDTLDPTVWDAVNESNPVLKSQHKDWIVTTILDTLKSHGYGDMDKWLDLYLTGSLTTFQYSDDSDCDVSLFVNTDVFPEWSRAEMIGVMVSNIDGVTLPGTTHPMQCYVVARGIRPEQLYRPGLRSGYDIQNDRWVVPPEKDRSHDVQREQYTDYQYALEQADKMERLLRYEPHKAVQFWHQIHMRRQADQKAGKGDYAQSNIIYKFLANRGLFPQLSEVSGEYIAKMADWTPDPTPLPNNLDAHWLTWEPGKTGKGFILENGRVWTWPTENLRPMHLQRAYTVNKVLKGRIRPETAFHIDEQGNVFTVGPGRHLDHWDVARLNMADHRLKPTVPPEDTAGFGHSQEVYDRLRQAAFFNDETPRENLEDEFESEMERERIRRNELRALPNVMYHVAPTNRRDSIATRGLVPDAERINNESDHPPGVYFWEDPEVTWKYRAQGPNMHRDMDMYAVQVPPEHRIRDPWFDFNHQDRSGDFPGAHYTEHGIAPEFVHPFYDSPWHKRSAVHPWAVNDDAVENARTHLGLQLPVKVNQVEGTHGQYHGVIDGAHHIDVVRWLRPESASKQVWHELTHAKQQERNPAVWQRQLDYYNDIRNSTGHSGYWEHPWEVEARQNADLHPFPLVHGIPSTNEGMHVGQTTEHPSEPPSHPAWSFC